MHWLRKRTSRSGDTIARKQSKEKSKRAKRKRARQQAKQQRIEKHGGSQSKPQKLLEIKTHFDAIVVGCGPAGTTALKTMAEQGLQVLGLERSNNDKAKPCGGGVPDRLLEEFPYVDFSVVHTSNVVQYIYNDQTKDVDMKIHMLKRMDFDQSMRQAAEDFGASIWYNARIKALDLDKKEMRVEVVDEFELTITYDWLIGAGGVQCPIATKIGFKKDLAHIMVGVAESCLEESDTAKMYWTDEIEGYFWEFPKGDYANIGYGGKLPIEQIESGLTTFCEKRNIKLTDIQKWLIPINVTLDTLPYDADKNIILVGDSASFVNPMTGEGIYYAMKSGQEAGRIVMGEMSIVDYPSFMEKLYHLMGLKESAMNFMGDAFEILMSGTEMGKDVTEFIFTDGQTDLPQLEALSDDDKLEVYKTLLEATEEDWNEAE